MTSRNWCFTIHENHKGNPHDLKEWDKVSYVVFQHEVCPETKRVHWQGYVELTTPQRLSALVKRCPGHYERRRGTAEQASIYCKKDESRVAGSEFFEHGVLSKGQGFRADLTHLKDILDEGGSLLECYDADFKTTIRYSKSFKEYKSLIQKERDWMPEVELYWGEPRTGKSRKAHTENPGAYAHDGSQWWDGYDGQEVVIFDDFIGSIPLNTCLKICDRYPMSVPFKGGYTPLLAKKIIFTSNLDIDDWYSNTQEIRRRALRARFSKIIFYASSTEIHLKKNAQEDFISCSHVSEQPKEDPSQRSV